MLMYIGLIAVALVLGRLGITFGEPADHQNNVTNSRGM